MPRSELPSQRTISTYFQPTSSPPKTTKRTASPIDLTSENEDGEPGHAFKRVRMTNQNEVSSASYHIEAAASSVVETWRYSPERQKSHPGILPSPPDKNQRERREALKKLLLQDNKRFFKPEYSDGKDIDEETPADSKLNNEGSGSESDYSNNLAAIFSYTEKKKSKGKAKATVAVKTDKRATDLGPSGQPYTPLEKQIIQLKKDNLGTVLMIEVGYKYKFYGEDAKVAAKELGMVSFIDRNFLVASIPVHRRDIHIKKLLSAGHRVGIVDQNETAALKKVSANRNAPFDRKLTHLYTAATYIENLDSVDDAQEHNPSVWMCLVEEEAKGSNGVNVSIGMVTVCASTGDVVWDDFEDGIMRLELETRLVHTRPAELLISKNNLSSETRKMIHQFTGLHGSGQSTHVETLQNVMSYSDALEKVTQFYSDKKRSPVASENFKQGNLMAATIDFPKRVIIALAHAIKHLSAFGIADAFSETEFFAKFTTRAHMLLAANTIINLEIYRNEDNFTERGSLIWVLDRTKTKFGARLLRSWVGRPLVDKRLLKERVDAVQEILESSSEKLLTLRGLLKSLPDLARGLCRIQYGQCTMKELAIILPSFNKVANAYDPDEIEGAEPFRSKILNQIVRSLPLLRKPMQDILQEIDLKKVAEGDKTVIWTDWDRHPEIEDAKMCLQVIEMELDTELKAVRKQLRMPSLEWKTVAIDDYLVEVKSSNNKPIPEDWILHSRTKTLARYQPPSVQAKLQERAQRREILVAEAEKAYQKFLSEISDKYYGVLRNAVTKLATADCLLSLAQVALRKDYVRPEFANDDGLQIVDGRHPILEEFSDEPYIPNSITLGGEEACTKIITGPNMGGKSSCVRMIALIALMAQIGSYVPAASVKMGLLDSILTRMGASDDLARGRSTFMVEMSETREILQTATSRSLVILDELGRGTSTFDGMAIADATLQYLVEQIKCKTLFITHYPLLATKLQSLLPKEIQNIHMGYEADSRIDGSRRITFLFRLKPGLATESFGIECARLANIPEEIVSLASERAMHMQDDVQQRTVKNRLQRAPHFIQQFIHSTGICRDAAAEDLRGTMELLRISSSK